MSTDYRDLIDESWRERLGWDKLSEAEQDQLGRYALYNYGLGKHTQADIESVKYGGRLVTLDDGSRWEVDSLDEYTAERWGYLTKVVVIDDKMYNLDDAEAISVTEETD
ncbi:hypothetical protein V2J52_14175 [Georgenia sp. MJ173]|uniref:hypothetical protein n=1 Tax=Georgenia sunbinii TaxID=3117728 RepID=UPI002F26902E